MSRTANWMYSFLLGLACLLIASPAPAQVTFTLLDDLIPGPAGVSIGRDISDDGLVVVGGATSPRARGNREAFRWTAAEGMVGLGDLPGPQGGRFWSEAFAVSADGSVVVGSSVSDDNAFRWTAASGMIGLGSIQPAASSSGKGVSADGTVVVGDSGGQAFRWTELEGMVPLEGPQPPGFFFTRASDVSADGSVIVGGLTGLPTPAPFRWTASSGIQLLMDGADLLAPGSASAVSANGTVIVGVRFPQNEAFRWKAPGQAIGLGDLPGGEFRSYAADVSADGVVVVGDSDAGHGVPGLDYQLDAFFWTEETGMVNLREFLSAYGVTDHLNLSLQAYAVSANGRTIVGAAYDATGLPRAFIATIPEPSTLALATLVAFGGLIVLLMRRPLLTFSGP